MQPDVVVDLLLPLTVIGTSFFVLVVITDVVLRVRAWVKGEERPDFIRW